MKARDNTPRTLITQPPTISNPVGQVDSTPAKPTAPAPTDTASSAKAPETRDPEALIPHLKAKDVENLGAEAAGMVGKVATATVVASEMGALPVAALVGGGGAGAAAVGAAAGGVAAAFAVGWGVGRAIDHGANALSEALTGKDLVDLAIGDD